MTLRPRQRDQLHEALLEYLVASKFTTTSEAFRTETDLRLPAIEKQPAETNLAQKWTSLMRMQSKVKDLEKQLEDCRQRLQLFEQISRFKADIEGIPAAPELQTLRGHRQAVSSVLFHPIFLMVVTASDDSTIKVWDYDDGGTLQKSLNDHTDNVSDIAFDKMGKILASASADTSVKLWLFSQLECIRTLYGHDDSVSAVTFVNEDILASASRDKTLRIWEVETGHCLRTLSNHTEWVRCVAALDSSYGLGLLATGSSDHTIQVHCILCPEPLSVLEGHTHVVEDVCFATAPTLEYLRSQGIVSEQMFAIPHVADSSDQQLSKLADSLNSDKEKATLSSGPILFSSSRDCLIKMWDMLEAKCISTFEGHENWVKKIVCHPNGQYIMSVSDDKSLRVWDICRGTCVRVINAHKRFLTCIDVSLKSNIVATGSLDATVKLWQMKTGNEEGEAENEIQGNHTS